MGKYGLVLRNRSYSSNSRVWGDGTEEGMRNSRELRAAQPEMPTAFRDEV